MLIQGSRKDAVLIGRKIGSMMCYKKLQENYSKEKAAEFLGKWAKDFHSILEEAAEILRELTKERMEQYGEYNVKKMIGKVVGRYILMNCPEGKWNKEELRKHLSEVMRNKKGMAERYSSKMEIKNRQTEGKKA